MYSNGRIQVGNEPASHYSFRRAYRRATDATTTRRVDPYAYLEAHSGEYNEQERKIIKDPYADGWAWHDDGKRLSAFVVSRWLSAKAKAEFTRLFNLGFKDAEELSK